MTLRPMASRAGVADGRLQVLLELEVEARLGGDVNKVIITPPCIYMYGESLMKYTGWCQNDFNVQG